MAIHASFPLPRAFTRRGFYCIPILNVCRFCTATKATEKGALKRRVPSAHAPRLLTLSIRHFHHPNTYSIMNPSSWFFLNNMYRLVMASCQTRHSLIVLISSSVRCNSNFFYLLSTPRTLNFLQFR